MGGSSPGKGDRGSHDGESAVPDGGTVSAVGRVARSLYALLMIVGGGVALLFSLLVGGLVVLGVGTALANEIGEAAAGASTTPTSAVVVWTAGAGAVGLLFVVVSAVVVLATSGDASPSVAGIERSAAGAVGRWYRRRAPRTDDGTLPDGGTVRASGTLRVPGDPVRSPVDGSECAVRAYEVDAYDDETDARYATGDPVHAGILAGVDAVPFVVESEAGDVRVDPTPWDPRRDGDPDRTGRSHADYRTSAIRYPVKDDRVLAVEDLAGDFEDRARRALREREGELDPGAAHLAVTERRLEPGGEVTVLGWSVGDRDYVDADVVNLPGIGHPFRIETDAGP